MFSKSSMSAVAVGGMISLSTIGFGAESRSIAAETDASPDPIAKVEKDASKPNQASGLPGQRLQLEGTIAPKYDGPVAWNTKTFDPFGVVALSGIFGLAAMGLASKVTNNNKTIVKSGLIVGGTVAAMLSLAASDSRSITFSTQVDEIVSSGAPYNIERFNGKSTSRSGPHFPQTLRIAQTDLLLSASAEKAPFVPGQKIIATFVVEQGSDAILYWSATPAQRGQ